MYYVYPAVFKLIEGSTYMVTVPDIPGCVTEGNSIADAMCMARDALAGCLCSMEDHRLAIPPSSDPKNIALTDGEFLAMIDADTIRYRAETDGRAVRRNVSVPAWLCSQAESEGLSLSKVLQEALRERLNVS